MERSARERGWARLLLLTTLPCAGCDPLGADAIGLRGALTIDGEAAPGWEVRAVRWVQDDAGYSLIQLVEARALTSVDGGYELTLDDCDGVSLSPGTGPVGDPGGAQVIVPAGGRYSSEQLCARQPSYDFEMERPAAQVGGYVMAWSEPVGGVDVTIDGAELRILTTDDAGFFSADSLPWGEYTLSISGYSGVEFDSAQVVRTLRPLSNSLSFVGSPVPRPAMTSVSAGEGVSCAPTAEGEAFCWGDSPWRSWPGLGLPRRVEGDVVWRSLAIGSQGSCGLDADDRIHCWGLPVGGPTPSPILGDRTWSSLGVAGWHACGVTTERELYCWGRDGSTTHDPEPVGPGTEWASVDAGLARDCALTTAGDAYCWYFSPIGIPRLSPELVPGGHAWTSLSVGGAYVCGLANEGRAYCWGKGEFGQLGNGSLGDHTEPVAVSGGGHTWRSLSASKAPQGVPARHTCGIALDGRAYCWGSNARGQLGDGTTVRRSSPTPVATELLWTSISVGYDHTCGVAEGGTLYCWGANDWGELGDRAQLDRLTPGLVGQRW